MSERTMPPPLLSLRERKCSPRSGGRGEGSVCEATRVRSRASLTSFPLARERFLSRREREGDGFGVTP
jgi:hypothetical protein